MVVQLITQSLYYKCFVGYVVHGQTYWAHTLFFPNKVRHAVYSKLSMREGTSYLVRLPLTMDTRVSSLMAAATAVFWSWLA